MNTSRFLYAIPLLIQVFAIVMLEILLFRNFVGPHGDLRIDPDHVERSVLMQLILWMLLATMASLATMILYIVYALKKKVVPEQSRTGWIVAVVLLGVIAQTIFWFKFIRKMPTQAVAAVEEQKKQDFWNS